VVRQAALAALGLLTRRLLEEAADLLLPFITNVRNYIEIVTGVNSC
jgi:hypothetical protein